MVDNYFKKNPDAIKETVLVTESYMMIIEFIAFYKIIKLW